MYVTQMSSEEVEGVCVIVSAGILIEKTKDRVTIARDDMQHDDQWRGVLVIPRENVVKMKVLTP
jgi:hypothetical protein